MKGIALMLGKPEPEKESGSSAEAFAKEAFAALKDDDEEGFTQAFLAAVRACKGKSYEAEDEDDEE